MPGPGHPFPEVGIGSASGSTSSPTVHQAIQLPNIPLLTLSQRLCDLKRVVIDGWYPSPGSKLVKSIRLPTSPRLAESQVRFVGALKCWLASPS